MSALALVIFVLGATLALEFGSPESVAYVGCLIGATGSLLRLGGG